MFLVIVQILIIYQFHGELRDEPSVAYWVSLLI